MLFEMGGTVVFPYTERQTRTYFPSSLKKNRTIPPWRIPIGVDNGFDRIIIFPECRVRFLLAQRSDQVVSFVRVLL